MLTLENDTVIVSDVHFSKNDISFINALDEIKSKQIILNGDIFEFLCEDITSSIKYNQELINKINILSKNKKIIYIEGNHDFNLKSLFPNIITIPFREQPLCCFIENKKIYISHGDYFISSFSYELFTAFIRNKFILFKMNIADRLFNSKLFDFIINKQLQKNKCYKIQNFKKQIPNIIRKYPKDADIIIEGHHHQDTSIVVNKIKYINLPAFICNHKIHTISELIK